MSEPIIYIYDNSFDGLLTTFYHIFKSYNKPYAILRKPPVENILFTQLKTITTNNSLARLIEKSIIDIMGKKTLKYTYHLFLSEVPEAELTLYDYLNLGWRYGKKINSYLTHKAVKSVLEISNRLGLEKHRFYGLIRFKNIKNNIFYAKYEPDYNITSLLAPHFAKRLADQNWLIHDLKRGVAAIYYFKNQKWFLAELEKIALDENYHSQDQFINLWQNYYQNVNIEERKNPTLQKQYMPKRYWHNLAEKP